MTSVDTNMASLRTSVMSFWRQMREFIGFEAIVYVKNYRNGQIAATVIRSRYVAEFRGFEQLGLTIRRNQPWICIAFNRSERSGMTRVLQAITQFYLPPNTSHTCSYFPAAKHHRPRLVLIALTHEGMARLS